METIFQDFHFAIRAFRRSPGFTFAVLFTLALGIGANTAIFSVVDAALLHPVPFPQPGRLASLYQTLPQGGDENAVSYPNLLDWQQQSRTFEAIAGVRSETFTLIGRGDPELIPGLGVSSNLLSVLRVQPVLGRMFTQEEDQRGGRPVALLSEGYWKRRFGGNPQILGQTLNLNGRDVEVIGIMPASVRLRFYFQDIFTPLGQNDNPLFYNRSSGDDTEGMGRLRPGVSLTQARAEMDTIMRNLVAQYPNENYKGGVNVLSYIEDKSGSLRPLLVALSVAVGFVLLIACTNVANLMLARSASRSQEFGIRVALGARRGRMIRQLLTESVLLSLAGGALGVLLALWYTRAAISVLPSVLPVTSSIQINQRLIWFSVIVSLMTSLLFGLAPAFKASDLNVQQTLRESGRSILGARHRAQSVLVVAEIALTLIVLIGAGLMLRSLRNLWAASPGFRPDNVLVFHTSLSPQRFTTPESIRRAFRELNDRLSSLPGVDAASIEVGSLPFMGTTTTGFSRADETVTNNELRIANLYVVGRDHFRAMGIPLLRGRFFTAAEIDKDQRVAVVDEELARETFPGQDALGKSIRRGLSGNALQIVGIAGHVKHSGIDSDASAKFRAELYLPLSEISDRMLTGAAADVTGIVHSRVNRATLINSIRTDLRSFNGDRAVSGENLMTDAIAGSFAPRRFSLVVLGAFAVISLILAIVGVYGVVSYVMSERTQEIGVRMALGAEPRDVLLRVLRDGAVLGGIGVAIGLAAAAVLTRLMANLLFGVAPTDFLTFTSAGALLMGFTVLACFVPARRAASLSPLLAMGDQRQSNWRAARLRMQRAVQEMLIGSKESVVSAGNLINEFAGSVRSAGSFAEAATTALAILREQTGAQFAHLLEQTGEGAYRGVDCSLPAQGFLINRLKHYPHPLTLLDSDFDALVRWAREFKPERTEEMEALARSGARIAVPLRTKLEMVGVLLLGPPAAREAYTPAEKEALSSAAEVFALMIENSRLTGRALEQEKLRRDLDLAAEVQQRLLPPEPPSNGAVALAAFMLPARTVGGDYYDFLELDGRGIGIAVADVSGKGVAAGLLMAVVQASLRVISAEKDVPLSQLAERMNSFLYRSSGASKYATFFYAQLQSNGRRLRFVNAGHNPPLLAHNTEAGIQVTELGAGGPPLGLFPKMQYEEAEVELLPGDAMLAFTDGVPEALNEQGEEFGEIRLKELLCASSGSTAEEIAAIVSREVRDWIGAAEQHDDITLVAVKV
ncbi:MAG: SpoIIE family protein phosphatase [Bryobacterales bacterium]|nr:SpoIIE family protein phosphatase [Bryobacterales bacterium]